MPKVKYTATQGLVQETGRGVQLETLPFSPVQTITGTANLTGSLPGVYVFSTDAVATFAMPLAASYPGGVYVFKNATGVARANVLTGSQEATTVRVFAGPANNAGAYAQFGRGASLALDNTAGASVTLVSDGSSFCVMASSGSYTISNP